MAGIHLDHDKAKASIQNWINTVISPDGIWEGNDLHIDEIGGLSKITRPEWIDASFMILSILPMPSQPMDQLILFLHIGLEDSSDKMDIRILSLNWLKQNVNEYTPPSLHFSSLEYYTDFYENELIRFIPDDSILKYINSSIELDFFYRTYFDEDEQMYSREVYIFNK